MEKERDRRVGREEREEREEGEREEGEREEGLVVVNNLTAS